MFIEKDIQQIENKGLAAGEVEKQIQNFINGFPFLSISKPATINDGIINLKDDEVNAFVKLYGDINPDTLKFVPASGAASRMFKFLFEFYEKAKEQYENVDEPGNDDVKLFFKNIRKFAFFNELESILASKKLNIDELLKSGRFKEILKHFLFDDGLNYGQNPKGVLSFHGYENKARTAFEEHLVEGALYSKSSDNKVKIHFTISPEHQNLFLELLEKTQNKFENEFCVKFDVSFSQQKPSTDMVAVDLNNELFRNNDDSLLFRPGGHGALIENLNDLEADIIFIKNIDNIVPDKLKDITVKYKKALAGVLLSYREKIFNYIEILQSEEHNTEILNEVEEFIKTGLCFDFNKNNEFDINSRADFYFNILNRPIRVCGMVKNEGEPGGGPFWVKHNDGSVNLQIVESSQIDQNNPEQLKLVKTATHFNPVDLICSTKDYKGDKFDLIKYRDSNTGFISKKSKDGRDLKAQELPGLWNGAMAHWNTIFVEVPILTFNPVKTINDLLRVEHQ